MKKVQKVVMFVYKQGEPDKFFVVHRQARGGQNNDFVMPTGHIEEGESIEAAASREVEEEFGVNPIKVVTLPHVAERILENHTKHSTEYAVLVEIPNISVIYQERGEEGDWHELSELPNLLTYEGQKGAVATLVSLAD